MLQLLSRSIRRRGGGSRIPLRPHHSLSGWPSWLKLAHVAHFSHFFALGRVSGALGRLLAGLGCLSGGSWLSGTSPPSILGASRLHFEGPRTLILENPASILSNRCHSIPGHSMHTVPFHSTSFHPMPFHCIAFRSIPFHSIPFHSIAIPFPSKTQVFEFPSLQSPIGLGGMREA